MARHLEDSRGGGATAGPPQAGRSQARGPRRASLIAGANAWFRAWETRRAAGQRILEDPWAGRLADRDLRLLLVRFLRWVIPPLGQVVRELVVAHCVRHRAIDELLLAAVRQDGFTQIVVLGAGYDMRPSRFAAASGDRGGTVPGEGSLRWIEIDDAWTQARKRRRLAGQAGVRAVVHESCDLAAEPLAAPLARAGFDPTRPTCFVLEGLIHYLAAATIVSLLDTIATTSTASVRVIFSCIDPPMRRSATPVLTSLFRMVGEIPRSFLDPARAAALLADRGFTAVSSWSFKDQIDRLLPAGLPERRSLHARWWQTVVQADRRR